MAVVVESFVEHFDRSFDAIKEEAYSALPKEWPAYMQTENTTRPFIKTGSISGLGLPQRNRDLERLPFDQPFAGPIAYFQPVTYRLGYQIERQTVEDELWGLLANRPMTMLRGSAVLMDMVAADILNNGFTLQTYDMGGTALFSASQVREDNMATWSNLSGTNQPITVETVFTTIVDLLYNMVDYRGFPIVYSGTINLFVPALNATLWQQAVEVINSINHPNTADNRINAAIKQFTLNLVPLRFATNPDHWFLAWAPGTAGYGLKMVIRQNPDITPLRPFSDNPDAWFSRMRQRFVAGYDNKRGIAAVGA